jgi:hypothetical protein
VSDPASRPPSVGEPSVGVDSSASAEETGETGETRALSPGAPAFAKDFPQSAALDELVAAFARGDYARVRRGARELEARSEDPAVKAAARTLVERTQADPLAIVLFALTFGLLVALTAYWIAHNGPGPKPAAKPPPVEHVKS